MDQDQMKRAAAEAALAYIEPGSVLGVGTGSTVNHLIKLLGERKIQLAGAVSSSEASSERLRAIGITVLDLNEVDQISVYIDGADEVNAHGHMIKGGGGALTREKIVASASDQFICIADASKHVDVLGDFGLPVEVIPMARSLIARRCVALGGRPAYRAGFITDNGNHILDVQGLSIIDPPALEAELNNLPGVVANGLFVGAVAAATVILGTPDGARSYQP